MRAVGRFVPPTLSSFSLPVRVVNLRYFSTHSSSSPPRQSQSQDDKHKSIGCVAEPAATTQASSPTASKGEKEIAGLSDDAILKMLLSGEIQAHALEAKLGDLTRAVRLRRRLVGKELGSGGDSAFSALPYEHYDYNPVMGACCENVVGYVPIPVGIAGPLLLDGKHVQIPMATTEGCLVASTHRGCKAISKAGGG